MAEPVPLTIRRDWPRPDARTIEAFRNAPTGFVVDAIGRAGAIDHRIKPVWGGPAFVGSALPVWTTARDNLAPYAAIKFAATLAYGLAGFAGLEVFVRGLGEGTGKRTTIALFALVFALVGAQNAWVLRPYLVKPDATHVTFFTREREGGLAVQLTKSVRELLGSRRREPAVAEPPHTREEP